MFCSKQNQSDNEIIEPASSHFHFALPEIWYTEWIMNDKIETLVHFLEHVMTVSQLASFIILIYLW